MMTKLIINLPLARSSGSVIIIDCQPTPTPAVGFAFVVIVTIITHINRNETEPGSRPTTTIDNQRSGIADRISQIPDDEWRLKESKIATITSRELAVGVGGKMGRTRRTYTSAIGKDGKLSSLH